MKSLFCLLIFFYAHPLLAAGPLPTCSIANEIFKLRPKNETFFENFKFRLKLVLNDSRTPKAKKELADIERLFERENLVFSTAHPEDLRELIQSDVAFSFKNTFQLNGKSSAHAPMAARAEIEAFRSGLSVNEYLKYPEGQKPFYGYLQFKKSLNDSQTGFLKTGYGEDIWVLNTDDVIDTTSFTLGDSMTYKGYHKVFGDLEPTRLRGDYTTTWNQGQDPHTFFLPFKENKHLLIEHYLEEALKEGSRGLYNRKSAAKPFYNRIEHWNTDGNPDEALNYIELQFFNSSQKRFGINQVKEFIFTKNPPNEELYQFLKQNNVEIKDWRIQQDDPVTYIPFSEGGLSEQEFRRLKIAKDYIHKLQTRYYVRSNSPQDHKVILESTQISEKKERYEFLMKNGININDAGQIIKADIPAGLDPEINLER